MGLPDRIRARIARLAEQLGRGWARFERRLPRPARSTLDLLGDTAREGSANNLGLYAPAIAYALVVSLGPLTLAVRFLNRYLRSAAGLFPSVPLGDTLSAGQLFGTAASWAGPFSIVVIAVLVLWGASSLFRTVAVAIHVIWHDERPGGLRGSLRSRALAVLLLLVMGTALFVSAVFGSAAAGLGDLLMARGGALGGALTCATGLASGRFVLDFLFAAVFSAAAFTAVPEGDQRLRNVYPGVIVTAAAYSVGQQVLARYLAGNTRLDALGTVGPVVAFLVWAYYTALIILWGAELTYHIALRRRSAESRRQAARAHSTGPATTA